MEVAKKVQFEKRIEQEKRKLADIHNIPDYMDVQQEEIKKHITDLNDDLKTRQESIDILKGRLTNQITSFKETIAKVLDKGTSLTKKDTDAVSGARNYDCFHSHSCWNGYQCFG